MAAPDVRLRHIEDRDIDVFFEQQNDPEAAAMAAFPSRDRETFLAHWARIRADETTVQRTVVVDGLVAGNLGSWRQDGAQLVGYWFGREYWGRGIGTRALAAFLEEITTRPLYAHVASHNLGSIRVLEKCGFRRDREAEATAPPSPDGVEEVILVLSPEQP